MEMNLRLGEPEKQKTDPKKGAIQTKNNIIIKFETKTTPPNRKNPASIEIRYKIKVTTIFKVGFLPVINGAINPYKWAENKWLSLGLFHPANTWSGLWFLGPYGPNWFLGPPSLKPQGSSSRGTGLPHLPVRSLYIWNGSRLVT